MILDGIICPTRQQFGNLGPMITEFFVRLNDDPLLIVGPLSFDNLWIEMVMPALATLLADPTIEFGRNYCPPLGPILINQPNNLLILFGCPWTFLGAFLLSICIISRSS